MPGTARLLLWPIVNPEFRGSRKLRFIDKCKESTVALDPGKASKLGNPTVCDGLLHRQP